MPNPNQKLREGYEIQRPNRDKAASKTMRAIVLLLLLASVVLILVISIGGWDKLESAKYGQLAWVFIYVIFAYYVARWNRGVLPMIAALAVILGIFAGVSGAAWFDRDKTGFDTTTIGADVLGLLTYLMVPLQLLLVGASMSAFSQGWNVEVEVPIGEKYVEPDEEPPATAAGSAPA